MKLKDITSILICNKPFFYLIYQIFQVLLVQSTAQSCALLYRGPAIFFLNQWRYHKACGMKPYKVIEVLRGEINWQTRCQVPPAFLQDWVISDKANGHIMQEAYQTILQFLSFSLIVRLNHCFRLKSILFMFWFAAWHNFHHVICNNRNHVFF